MHDGQLVGGPDCENDEEDEAGKIDRAASAQAGVATDVDHRNVDNPHGEREEDFGVGEEGRAGGLERNDGVTLETIALFIRFWLTSTPALPEQSSPAARAKGAERYDRFVEALGRRLSSGSTVLKEVSIEQPDLGNPAQVKGQTDSH